MDNLIGSISKFVKDLTDQENINVNVSLHALGLSSMQMIMLITYVEDFYDITFHDVITSDFYEMSVATLAEKIFDDIKE